ncbi:unnamed protein product [Meloidogyne enterolobii]|uniref:Uncharacterized protein n=1 Tax=Meloidogyne enterolobii TaxID=390850 RepID=A0ACB0XU51_MELEN
MGEGKNFYLALFSLIRLFVHLFGLTYISLFGHFLIWAFLIFLVIWAFYHLFS